MVKLITNSDIAKKNDQLRKTLSCKVHLTRSVAYSEQRDQILKAVKHFYQFGRSNDPYGEHDFGLFEIDGIQYFWKFDYYDSKYEGFRFDGNRVLTIGRMDEY